MQNFKSAADLGITETQASALQKTLVLLETGKLRRVDSCPDGAEMKKFSGQFNMCNWSAAGDCGTIACIGGTAELIGDVSFGYIYDLNNNSLKELFLPSTISISSWDGITPDQAATALRSYLTTGDARWDLAVA